MKNWIKKLWAEHKARQKWNAEQEYRADLGYNYQSKRKSK